ncbi:hypothetical protein EGM92_08895 [Enterobacter cloacae]|nr:hypothetical protein EGM92_08895 [Enterobacter cloacae]
MARFVRACIGYAHPAIPWGFRIKKIDSRTTGLPFHFQPAGNTTFWRRPLPFWITLFIPGYSLTKKRCYHSPRKYLSTLPEALMLENVII